MEGSLISPAPIKLARAALSGMDSADSFASGCFVAFVLSLRSCASINAAFLRTKKSLRS